MPSIPLIVCKLTTDYPQFTFTPGDADRWDPLKNTIFYSGDAPMTLLHELAHAILGHNTYIRDIELIGIERDAWNYAKEQLAPTYAVQITEEVIAASLDSYRDWLHARSTCPSCSATGIQTDEATYKCLACHTVWRVNEARLCALRRYMVSPN